MPDESSPEAEPTTPDAEPVVPDVSAEDVPKPDKAARTRAQANRSIKYVCSRCGREVGRDNLVSSRMQFLEMGVSGKILKTKGAGWICRNVEDNCLEKDPLWIADRAHGVVPTPS